MASLSRFQRGLEYIKQPDRKEATPVPVDEQTKLLEQIILLLGQASDMKTYGRRLNILNSFIKDPRKQRYSEGESKPD